MDKGYCLMCGNLRDLVGGMCEQCRVDRAVTMRKPAARQASGKAARDGKPAPSQRLEAHRAAAARAGKGRALLDMRASAGPRRAARRPPRARM